MKWTPAKIACGMFLLALLSLVGVSTPVFATDPSVTLTSSYQVICENNSQNPSRLPCSDYTILKIDNPNLMYGQITVVYSKLNEQDSCENVGNVQLTTSNGAQILALNRYSYFSDVSSACAIQVRVRNTPSTSDLVATLTNEEEQEPCPECQECPVCPAIPENPYDDKLDAIKVAIYVVAGTILVIYFFYCIYRMIIKGGKL